MKAAMLEFSLIRDTQGFAALREDWNALCERAGLAHLFARFDWWFNAWTLSAEPRGYGLRLVTGRRDGRLVLAWPLVVDGRVLRLLTTDSLEYRDILHEPSADAPHWVDEAWAFVRAQTAADVFLFQNLRSPNTLAGRLAREPAARAVGARWCPVIRLEQFAGWEAYAARLPRGLMSDQRRQWRRLAQALPGMSFRLVERSEQVGPVFDWIVHNKVAWGESRQEKVTVWFVRDGIRECLRRAAKQALADDKLVMATISDGERIASAGWGYLCGPEFLFHSFAFDLDYATYSPSRLLLEGMVRHCFERGVRTFDFMPGPEQFKYVWSTDFVEMQSYVGHLNWRGACLMKLAAMKSAEGAPRHAARRLYRMLPHRVRDLSRRSLRPYRLLTSVLQFRTPGPPTLARAPEAGPGPGSRSDA